MGSGSVRVLHVDDEPDFAELAVTYLEREDERLTVETATSADEGLDRLADADFDCVVSDYDMPRTDGIEFLERVRQEHPDLPFILFTGKGSEAVASDAISAGVTDYLQKERGTSQYELLANRITNAVESHRTKRRAELQQRQSRAFFQDAPVMYVVTRDEGGQLHIEDCNDRFLERLGYDHQEVIDRPISAFYAEESKRKMHDEGGYEQALNGEFGLQERTLVAADGERVHVLNRANPRLDSQGTPVGAQGMYLDITERKERERRLELAIEQTRSGVWEYDAESGMVTRHEGATDLWAEDAGTTVPMADAIAERVHPEDRQAIWNALEATVEDDDPYHVEFRHTTPDGYRWAEARGELLREHDAEPGRLIACTTDIHAHKEREAQLREERNRLAALFDDAPQPMIEGELRGADHYPIVGVNDAFETTFGYEADEIVGRDAAALVPDEDRAEAEWFRERVADGESFSAEVERTTAEGERTFLIDIVSHGTDATPADGWFATYTDITERKERERELELYETMVETVPDGVYVLDENFKYVAVNRGMADLTGYAKDELVGSHASLINDEETMNKARRDRERLLRDGIDDEVIVTEHPHITADGESIPTEARFRALPPDDDGSFRGTAGVVRDISDRLETEEQLREERDRLGALFEDAPRPILESEIDADEHRIAAVNDAFTEVFGYDRAEIVGQSVPDTLVPENEQAAHERFRERVAAGESLSAEVKRTTVDGERTFLLDIVPYGTESPPADGAFASYTDITGRKERERELELYETMLETVPDGVYALDEDLQLLAVNRGLADMLDYSQEELVGSHLSLINTEGGVEIARRNREQLLGEDGDVNDAIRVLEHVLVTRDGEEIPCEARFRALPPDEDGSFRGTAGIVRDITERKAREQELERYEQIVQTMNDGVVVVEDGRITYTNPQVTELVGYTAEELAAEPMGQFIAPEYRETVRRRFEERIAGEDPPETYEIEVLSTDDERIPVEITVAQSIRDGSPATVSIVRDISQRKQRQRELERYEQIVNMMDEAACIYDENGRFVVANAYLADFYGTTPAALEGEPSNLIPKIRAERDGDAYQELLDGEREEIRGEIDGEFPGHGYEVLSYRLTPLLVDGEIEGAVGVAREVTAQRQRERELERQNERLEQFASVVSHDLRNPLNVAEGNVELAREECDSEYLDTVVRALDRMDALIEDILTVAREGTEVEAVEPVDLAAVVEGCWRNVATADATLVVDTELTIDADHSRFQQLLENLMRNAVEHGGADVTITVGDLDDGRGFYVEDDGPGIPPDERDAVFEYGYSTTEDGTGFGLAIVKEIAEAHGWTVDVTDSADGGARFEVTGVGSVE